MLAGCAETPSVGEYDTNYRYYQVRPGVYPGNYGSGPVQPVGERGALVEPEGGHNAIDKSWERPWPYSPVDAASPGYW
jgi:hypothetical protein